MLEMATLQKPFVEFEYELAASYAACRGRRPERPTALSRVANRRITRTLDDMWELLQDMWQVHADSRPSMATVLSRLELVLEAVPEHFQWP